MDVPAGRRRSPGASRRFPAPDPFPGTAARSPRQPSDYSPLPPRSSRSGAFPPSGLSQRRRSQWPPGECVTWEKKRPIGSGGGSGAGPRRGGLWRRGGHGGGQGGRPAPGGLAWLPGARAARWPLACSLPLLWRGTSLGRSLSKKKKKNPAKPNKKTCTKKKKKKKARSKGLKKASACCKAIKLPENSKGFVVPPVETLFRCPFWLSHPWSSGNVLEPFATSAGRLLSLNENKNTVIFTARSGEGGRVVSVVLSHPGLAPRRCYFWFSQGDLQSAASSSSTHPTTFDCQERCCLARLGLFMPLL